jgi:hypothetical protein
MERQRGVVYPTQHCDFMMEKATVMEASLLWAEAAEDRTRLFGTAAGSVGGAAGRGGNRTVPKHPSRGVLFLDSDVTLFEPLTAMFFGSSTRDDDHNSADSLSTSSGLASRSTAPSTSPRLGVSAHRIEPADEARFGRYNGGVLYCRDAAAIWAWRRATMNSRYFDQASIEDVVAQMMTSAQPDGTKHGGEVAFFPPQANYGYWRLFQAPQFSGGVEAELRHFSLDLRKAQSSSPTSATRSHVASGNPPAILYRGVPLQSAHTHFFMPTRCREVRPFNALLLRWLREVNAVDGRRYAALARLLL